MAARVLIAYATRYGSTAAVAETIGEVLREAPGAEVDVRTLAEAGAINGYDALVLGSPARMGRLLPESIRFARRHRGELATLRVAYFFTGLTMSADTPANRRQAESYLRPLRKVKEPLGIGLFGGAVDRRRLGPLLRFFAVHDRSGTLTDADYRDWDAIRRWAREMAPALAGGSS